MQVEIKQILDASGVETDAFYPGKRQVRKYQQPGQYKSHCFLLDWSRSDQIRLEIRAGVSGRMLDPADLKKYPVCFQAPTYLDIAVEAGDTGEQFGDGDDKEESTGGSKGKSGGGKKPARRKLEERNLSLSVFEKVMEGAIPEKGTIEKFVVMGKALAKEQFSAAFENLVEQLRQSKIMVMDLMKNVGNVIQKATPGGGLESKGNETVKYKYDTEKNGPMFGAAPS